MKSSEKGEKSLTPFPPWRGLRGRSRVAQGNVPTPPPLLLGRQLLSGPAGPQERKSGLMVDGGGPTDLLGLPALNFGEQLLPGREAHSNRSLPSVSSPTQSALDSQRGKQAPWRHLGCFGLLRGLIHCLCVQHLGAGGWGALRSMLGALGEEWGFCRSSQQTLPGSVLFSSSSQVAFAHWGPWHGEVSPGGATVWTSNLTLLPSVSAGPGADCCSCKEEIDAYFGSCMRNGSCCWCPCSFAKFCNL